MLPYRMILQINTYNKEQNVGLVFACVYMAQVDFLLTFQVNIC